MTNNSLSKSNLYDNNLNSSINNSKYNDKIVQKGTLSEQFIFFKEDILKDVKQFESRISLKYDMQNNINSNKINKIESIIEQINQKLELLSSSLSTDNSFKERIDKISNLNTKLEESLVLQDVRIKNIYTKLTETIDKYDNIFAETVIYPRMIGPNAKFKTFHELIDSQILNVSQLLTFKEKMNMEFKDYKFKTDSIISNFQIKLDYLIKNANAFTSSSIRTSEKKMEQLFINQLENFKNEFNEFKNEFNLFINLQEEKIISIIENSKKFEILKKIENFEKIIENSKENKKIQKDINKKDSNKNLNKHNKSMSNDKIIFIKSKKEENNININNNFNVKNATSILKGYINGKISENEIYKRRKSVNYQTPIDLQNKVNNESDNIILNDYNNNKKKNNNNINYSKIESIKNKIVKSERKEVENEKGENEDEYEDENVDEEKEEEEEKDKEEEKVEKTEEEKEEESDENEENEENEEEEKEEKEEKKEKIEKKEKNNLMKKRVKEGIKENIEKIEKKEEKKEEKNKEKKEYKNKEEKEEEGKKEEPKSEPKIRKKVYILKKDGNQNTQKKYKFQKYLERLSGNENNIIKRDKTNNIKLTKNSKNDNERLILNNLQLSPQFLQYRKNFNFFSMSNDSEIENEPKNMNKYAQINNANINFIIPNNYNNKNKTYSKPNISKTNIIFNNNTNKQYEDVNDVRNVINKIKRESRASLIPIINDKKKTDKSITNINNNDNSTNLKKINNNKNNISNLNREDLITKNKNINFGMNNNNTLSPQKIDFSKLKLQNTSIKIISPKNELNNTNLKLPYYENKKLNKTTSVDNIFFKSKYNNAKKIDINFNPFPENIIKDKDEENLKKIFNQMKDFIQNDEKILLKDRFIKYGYDKEKIFENDN